MDGEKKQTGRPQAYTRESQRYIQELELRRRRQEEQRERTASRNAGTSGRSDRKGTGYTRRREQENAQKMKILVGILGVLVLLLIAAIIYEIVLGHGVRETGRERMARQEQADVVIGADQDASGNLPSGAGQDVPAGDPVSETGQAAPEDTQASEAGQDVPEGDPASGTSQDGLSG